MSRFKPWQIAVAGIALVLVILVVWRLADGAGAPADDGPAPSALVTLAPVRADTVNETVSAYGVIAGSATASKTLAAPRALVVERVLAAVGSPVAAGAPVMVVVSAPAAADAYRQATDAVTFAAQDLERVQRLFDQHLAANDQLTAAKKALANAHSALAAQTAMGAGAARQTLTAPVAGVVATVAVAAGDHVAADAPLMTLVARDGLVAQLGVEPDDAAALAPGQAVILIPVFHSERRMQTRLTLVSRQVDPTSRMIDVTAPGGGGVPLGEAVRGEITVGSHPGLLVPKAAVAYDEDGAHVFVVAGGKARQVPVKAGAENGGDIEIIGAVKTGDQIAVEGAYQLQDGMAVRIAKP